MSGLVPFTDWPRVESDQKAWAEWARAAPPSSDVVHVVLEGEPIGKGRPRSRIATTHKGVQYIAVYTPRETAKYEEALAYAARAAMKRRKPFAGPLRVRVLAVMSVPDSWSGKRKRYALHGSIRPCVSPDWDNIGKCLVALNEICWLDDKQIVSACVEKVYGQLPRLEVEIAQIRADGLFST